MRMTNPTTVDQFELFFFERSLACVDMCLVLVQMLVQVGER
jgi:hypothetical protein